MSIFTTIPAQGEAKPGQLSPDQLRSFFDNGYLVIHNVYARADLEAMKSEIDEMVEAIAQKLLKAGKIADPCTGVGHAERLTRIEAQFPGATVLVHKVGACGPALRRLWAQPTVLNVMEQIVGPNIVGHPVWNIRPKAPGAANHDVPWHQDAAYMTADSEQTLQVTGWAPLLDTNAQNGCLQFLPGSHKMGKTGEHEGLWKDTWYIHMNDEKAAKLGTPVSEAQTVPVPFGSMVIFTNMTPHRSLPNVSSDIRWSLDLRWQSGDAPTGFDQKAPICFRRGGVDVTPDWETFNACNRQTIVETSSGDASLETTINPELWMGRWPLTHTNRHSDSWEREKKAKQA